MNLAKSRAEKSDFFADKRNLVPVALFYTFLWGCAFPLVKLCMQYFAIDDGDNISKCLVAGVRFLLAGLLTLTFCARNGEIRPTRAQVKPILLYGLLATSLQYSLTYIGLSRIDSSKGAIFDQLCVFLIVIFGGIFTKGDRLTLLKLVGCVIGFFGVSLTSVEGFSLDFSLGGEGIMTAAAICQTAAYFIAKAYSERIPAALLVGYGQLIGGGILTILSLALGGRVGSVSFGAILTLIALAAISAVAYVLSLKPLEHFPVSEVSSFNLLITIFGVVMSAVILGENVLQINYLLSLTLISFSIYLINHKGEKS